MMLFSKLAFVTAISAFFPASSASQQLRRRSLTNEEPDPTIGDIFGEPSIFKPSHSVTVDEDCNYEATLRINVRDAGLPFPSGPAECIPPGALDIDACNGKSCLFEQRAVYRFNSNFEKVTGFNHVGLDWSPCGHPPIGKFNKPHMNLHTYRVTPEERLAATCEMNSPFTCDTLEAQTEPNGRKFYVFGTGTDGEVANIPTFATERPDTAVPGEGTHAYDREVSIHNMLCSLFTSFHAHISFTLDDLNFTLRISLKYFPQGAPLVEEWFDPVLITGLYDGKTRVID